jgi:hypothetical protein
MKLLHKTQTPLKSPTVKAAQETSNRLKKIPNHSQL